MPKLCYSWTAWCPGCGFPGQGGGRLCSGVYPTEPQVALDPPEGYPSPDGVRWDVVYYLGRCCHSCGRTWRVRDPNGPDR